jgi:hypothetical protein
MKEKVAVRKTKTKKTMRPLELRIMDATILLKAGVTIDGFDIFEQGKNLLIPQFLGTYKGSKFVSSEKMIIPSEYKFPVYVIYDTVAKKIIISELMKYVVLASISYDGEKYYGWRF